MDRFTHRFHDSGRRKLSARLEIPSMEWSTVRGPMRKVERFQPIAGFDHAIGDRSRSRSMPFLLAIILFALTGCDLFDPAKTNDPVFGPPPPRKLAATNKATTTPPAGQTADNSPGSETAPASATNADGTVQPAAATIRGNAPPDEVIKRASFTANLPPATKKLPDTTVVAMVNGQPIFASEIFERAYPEPLPPEGLSLLIASKNIANGRVSEQDLRALQETAIKKYLKDYIRTRVLAQVLESKLEKEQKEKIEQAIGKMFDEYVEKLKKDLKVSAKLEVEQKLRTQGTSLASLKVEFRYRLLADEYLRQKSKKPHVVGRQEVLAYYEAHLDDYSYPEKVHWQLLEIDFAKHGGQAKSLAVLEKAIDALQRGENFAKVAKKCSDGPRAENGGQQSWTKPESVADAKTAALLHTLAPGEISPVVHAADSYRLIRLNARKPAGRHSLAEVQETIRHKIEERLQKEATQEVLVEVYKQASIESSFLSPEELGPPADYAGPSPATKNASNSVKKRRDRS
jgi:parvulin-like peptidyl-prolyl isomerase